MPSKAKLGLLIAVMTGLAVLVGQSTPAQSPNEPTEARKAIDRGLVAFENGQLEQAEAQFQGALTIDPKSTTAARKLALTRFKLEHYEDALEAYRKYFLLSPRDAGAFSEAALCFLKLGKPKEAKRYADFALSLDPALAQSYSVKVEILTELGDLARAIRVCDEAISKTTNSDVALSLRNRLAFQTCFVATKPADTGLVLPTTAIPAGAQGFQNAIVPASPGTSATPTNRDILRRHLQAIETYLARADARNRSYWTDQAAYLKVFAEVSGDDSFEFPKPVTIVRPPYQPTQRPLEGTLTTRLVASVSETGTVDGVTVVESLPGGLTEKAITALKKWTFEPARLNGKAVRSVAFVEIGFHTITS